MPRPLRPWRVLLAVAAATPALSADTAVTLGYDVRYGSLRLLSVQVATAIEGARYRSRSVMQTEGVVGLLYPWGAESVVSGSRDGARLLPHRHRAVGRYRNQERLVEIHYRDGGQVRSHVEPPPEADHRAAVPEALQHATVDPLTASVQAAADCRGSIPVFDGRRRYDLHLQSLDPVELPPAPPRVYAGPTRRCRAVVEALGGFWESDPRDSEQPTYLDYWLAAPGDGLPVVPVYVEITGARGTLRIDLVTVTPGATLPPIAGP